MKRTARSSPLLTYCTNVHPSGDPESLRRSLAGPVRAVRQALAWTGPFPVGLWISAACGTALSDPSAAEGFSDFLRQEGIEVATVNAFPYGDFHGRPVKREVYHPDWTDPERLSHTLRAARLAARLDGPKALPVSTLPGSFKPWGDEPARRAAIGDLLSLAALGFSRLREETGRDLRLCLEPEPFGTVESTPEAIAFFKEAILSRGAARLRREGLDGAAAEAVLRRHLGLCFDACHLLVAFEDLETSFRRIEAAGIGIGKVQVSACLEAEGAQIDRLRPYDEPRYLHQVSARLSDGRIRAWEDLPGFLAGDPSGVERARVHFHVPIDWKGGEGLGSPQAELAGFLGFLGGRAARGEACPLLEVETYTWAVLPEAPDSEAELAEGIAREIRWARSKLGDAT